MTCSECEYFGYYKESIYAAEWTEMITDLGLTSYYKKWLDFDVSKGAGCLHEKLRDRIRIYDHSQAQMCRYFEPRTWTKNLSSCAECMLCNWHDSDNAYCSGFPFYRHEGLVPCRNGRAKLGEQIRFDLG